MAPPLEYDKEPKAPDKSAATISNDDSKLLHNVVNDQQTNLDHKPAIAAANCEVENNKQVVNLDDGQLRALLDEAMNYKCPKDLEGKSNLFKELFQAVQQDEQQDDQASAGAARGGGRAARRTGGGRGRSQLVQSNSLQDLVAALAAEPAPRTRARHHAPAHPPAPVSARAIQGGSLPSGVDTSFLLGEEPSARGAGYLATVRCVNPPPLAERRVSASDANSPAELDSLHRRSKPVFPMTYTARATLEIGSGAVCSGRAVTTTTASNQGDSAIPFSCITTPEVVASCNTTSSSAQSAVAVDPKPLQLGSAYRAVASITGGAPEPAVAAAAAPSPPEVIAPPAAIDEQARQLQVFVPRLGLQPRSVISSSFNGLPLTRPNYGATATSAPEEYKKSLDENGNAVQGISSPVSGSSQHKKPRRKKSSKNETVIKSDQIDGYKGDKDLNEVLRFIESNAEQGRGKLGRAKHKDDADDKGKKRSTERRKDKESKLKRASSLEELSRTKLEDLTEPRPPPAAASAASPAAPAASAAAPAKPKPERRSWGDDAREPFYYRAPSPPSPPAPAAPVPEPVAEPAVTSAEPAALELTDFQTVTKRRKPRRRTDEPERDPPPRRPRPPSPRARRESAPPSDRSNDSNDDLDSVHSLPADATPARPPAPPHASYADIARTRHNIPDLIESCNFYAEGDGAGAGAGRRAAGEREPTGAGDADYPALGLAARHPRKPPPRRDRKDRPPPPAPPDCPAPDVVADRRPPVILLDSAARPRDLDGVTFGFDINEQLLGGPARRPRCDLVRDALETTVPPVPGQPAPGQTALPAAALAAAPPLPAHAHTGPPAVTTMTAVTQAGGVRVRVRLAAGCALRYVPPAPPPDTRHLHQLVDYVGSAWEDVVRCGGGKVRYFSE